MAKARVNKAGLALVPTMNNTLTSGITKSDTTLPIARLVDHFTADGVNFRTIVRVNNLLKAIEADAAEGFGEHIFTFPAGLISPQGALVRLVSTCATGLSATAGEVGLGSVIATGAIATLGAGAATMEDLMEGTTLSNHVAATALTSFKANKPELSGTEATHGVRVLDGSATPIKCHLNLASTWNQTAAESVTFGGMVCVDYAILPATLANS